MLKKHFKVSLALLCGITALVPAAAFAPDTSVTVNGGSLSITAPTVAKLSDVNLNGTAKTTTTAVGNFRMRYVIAVQVDVLGGWQAAMSIPEASVVEHPSNAFLGVHLKNSGEVLLRPTGIIKVKDESGKTVVEPAINMGTFVTGTEVPHYVLRLSVLKPGSYNMRVELNYGEGKTANYNQVMRVETPRNEKSAQPATRQRNTGTAQGNADGTTLQEGGTNFVAAAREPWVDNTLGLLLLMIVALLTFNFVVGGRRQKEN